MALPLTVGFDGSGPGLRALDWAVDEAAVHGRPLRVVYASRWEWYELSPSSPGRGTGQAAGRAAVEAAALRARERNPDVPVQTEVLADDPRQALLRESRTSWALVTGSRGRGGFGDLLLGSVSLAVAGRALCPVVVVRGDEPALRREHRRVLLGVADTPGGPEAVRFAVREAEARPCELTALHAWRCPAHERAGLAPLADGVCLHHRARAETTLDAALTGPLAGHGAVPVRRTLVEGPAAGALLDRTATADLVVVGAHRRPHHLGLQLGRVAHALLHHAHCPVAVVPQVDEAAGPA
ncbi:universal stress protein [Streptomyces sp. WAC06614]|uniref:universal stress protein n=1 Tax=Streptomyces sp. WAC06614 TaxID=2487416 RepID=UPI000F7976C3|nr:universal stress protein [Streptomyces sp. WAC06614]RSS66710.1 universal stress protein [Streptomyces sp. WAC06614]